VLEAQLPRTRDLPPGFSATDGFVKSRLEVRRGHPAEDYIRFKTDRRLVHYCNPKNSPAPRDLM
jgi:hypothetical protein